MEMSATEHRCPTCQVPFQEGDAFCEQCGAQLTEPERSPNSDDRTELDLAVAAVVSDRGVVHRRNEDSFYLTVGPERTAAVVVCDGTSSASAGNAAAREATQAAGTVLAEAIADLARDGGTVTEEAIQAAQDAVTQVPWTTRTRRVDPSCTIVSALCREGEIVIGWVGDSRAYWVDDDGARQLTVDDSFAEEGVTKGLLTPEQAAKSPFLHAITNWVGPNAPERPPHTAVLRPDRRGRLVLCTDGMWNYTADIDELDRLFEALPSDASPAEVARALTDTALAAGGHDNITVAVVDIEPTR
jgi:serine/threonine protein phosphatase PrpC